MSVSEGKYDERFKYSTGGIREGESLYNGDPFASRFNDFREIILLLKNQLNRRREDPLPERVTVVEKPRV